MPVFFGGNDFPFFVFLVLEESDDEEEDELDEELLELLEVEELEDVEEMTGPDGRLFFLVEDFLPEAVAPRLTGVGVGAGGVLRTILD